MRTIQVYEGDGIVPVDILTRDVSCAKLHSAKLGMWQGRDCSYILLENCNRRSRQMLKKLKSNSRVVFSLIVGDGFTLGPVIFIGAVSEVEHKNGKKTYNTRICYEKLDD